MPDSNLEVLKQNRDDLLRAEMAALLHDMGKFCDFHIKHVSGEKKWANDDGYKAIVDDPGALIHLSAAAANIKKPDVINNVLNAQSPKAADFLSTDIKDALTNTRINLFAQDYALAELIMLGMPGFATHQQRGQLLEGKDGWLPALLGVCHSEAHVDKEEPLGGQQTLPRVLMSNAFGFEQQIFVLGDAQKSLDAHLKLLPIDAVNLITRETHDKIVQAFERGLGDTRRPINEVTLADWSEIVAALFKSALAGAMLNANQPCIRQWKSWKDKIIDHDLHWRILRVNFDELALYAKAIKIADLLGYHRAVKEACAAVKQLIEEEYPLGNEIYRDTTGIYFTFPDIDLPAELAQEIRQRVEAAEAELAPRVSVDPSAPLKTLLSKSRLLARTDLAYPIAPENLSLCWQSLWETVGEGQWEVCPVCRLRPMKEGKEACEHCAARRGSRIETWKAKPTQTIWMDEIADAHDRVALLVGKFGLDDWLSGDLVQTMLVKAVENDPSACVPKNPSPARLRRVWETTEKFWTETVRDVLNCPADPSLRRARLLIMPDKENGWEENVPYDGTVGGKLISLLWSKKEKHFITISNLQLATSDVKDANALAQDWRGKEIIVSDPDDPRRHIPFHVLTASSAAGDFGQYAPYLPLLSSPDQFLALVPAGDALDIAAKIRGEYQEQFGKVQNRLPLFLGLVFFPRKTPLAAVIDTARRMLAQVEFKEETWQIETVNGGQVKFTNGVEWTVPTTMDDGSPDVWYPYFRVQDATAQYPYCFDVKEGQFKGRWARVAELNGQAVCVTPSRFAYLFLESTAQRFRFDPQPDARRLDELPRLMKMWCALKQSSITDTALRGVASLLESKGAAWGATSAELERLAETTLKQAKLFNFKDQAGNPLADVVIPNDVTSGRFARCLELHTKILKLRIKEEQHERQLETV